jgi:nucleoside-diphosphate-sugar epimerase
VDREAEEAAGTFGKRVAALKADVVVDMICFTPDSAAALVEALRGRSGHLIHCGTIWRYGPSVKQPMREDDTSPPFGEYGTQKAAIAELLAAETASGGLVTTVLQPGHISGPGWTPIGPLGNLDPGVWYALSAGQEVAVPGLGAELMHHVHADDVAQAFQLAVDHRDAAAGESFNVVAPSALTARGFLAIAAGWFGQTAKIRSVSWAEFRSGTTAEFADASWGHLSRSQYASIEKARTLLGYTPAFEPEAAVLDGIRWLIDHDQLEVANRLVS